LRIIGIRIEASAAVSAAADPDRLAMMMAAITVTMPRPPRMCPTQASDMSTIRRDMPPTVISSPASMKKGIASSGKLSAPTIMFWATTWASKLPW